MLEDLTVSVIKDCIGEQSYTFGFRIFDPSHLEVIRVSESGETFTTLTFNSDYTVSGQAGLFVNGGVVTTTATYTDGKLYIGRKVPLKQQAHFPDTGRFPAKPVEDQFDKMVMMIQSINSKVIKAVRGPDADPETDNVLEPIDMRKGGFLYFRETDGKPISVAETLTTPASSFVAPAMQLETSSAFLNYFGAMLTQEILRTIAVGIAHSQKAILSEYSVTKGLGNTLNISNFIAILRNSSSLEYHLIDQAEITNWVPHGLIQDNVTTNYIKLTVDANGVPTIALSSTPAGEFELLLRSFVTVTADIPDPIPANPPDRRITSMPNREIFVETFAPTDNYGSNGDIWILV